MVAMSEFFMGTPFGDGRVGTSIRAPEANAKSRIDAETLRVKRQSIADLVAEYDRAEMAAARHTPPQAERPSK